MNAVHKELLNVMYSGKPIPELVRVAVEEAELSLSRVGGRQLGVHGLCGVIGGVEVMTALGGICGDAKQSESVTATMASVRNAPGRGSHQRAPIRRDGVSHVVPDVDEANPRHTGQRRVTELRSACRVVVAYNGRQHNGTIIEAINDDSGKCVVALDFDLLPWRGVPSNCVTDSTQRNTG